jgi:hypothetical protein
MTVGMMNYPNTCLIGEGIWRIALTLVPAALPRGDELKLHVFLCLVGMRDISNG